MDFETLTAEVCRMTDFYGNGHFMEGHHIIATNGPLHTALQGLIQEMPPLGM